jgi:hypothetical protein
MKPFLLIATAVLLGLGPLPAAEPNFSVTIVGEQQRQEHHFRDAQAKTDHGSPVIPLPVRPATKTELGLDKASPPGTYFYVVVQNLAKDSVRLDFSESDWYECLSFLIKTPDGKTFHVSRPLTEWWWNPLEPWIFQPDGMRVFTVNFTTGRWPGLPPYESVRSGAPFKITASFGYYDRERRKGLVFSSSETQVQNGP